MKKIDYKSLSVSLILPTFNEAKNIYNLLVSLASIKDILISEIIVVDDDSSDGTSEIVRDLHRKDNRIRLISRVGRSGLASAIKEGLLNSLGEIAVVMDSDGQHDPVTVNKAVKYLINKKYDLVIGSRFHKDANIYGLSSKRERGSKLANSAARFSLSKKYSYLTDYMSGFFVVKTDNLQKIIRKINVNGFKFLFELLALSNGNLRVGEVPLNFLKRDFGTSKLELPIIWDFLLSLLHSVCFRIIPRRAISFGLVGLTGIFVQLIMNFLLMDLLFLDFKYSLPISVIIAASSNYLINNALTFRFQRLVGFKLIIGLLKFLIVSSLPIIANVGLASTFYKIFDRNIILAQLAGIIVVFIWNYAASSKLVWNTP